MPTLNEWAARWRISSEAVADLRQSLYTHTPHAPVGPVRPETEVQAAVRLEASKKGLRLWRNNVGVMPDLRGVPIRFGLANDSPAVNTVIKSSDLIGIRPVLVDQAMVGSTVGQFVSREIKRPGWRYRATEREKAQLAWLELIAGFGGDACFATGEGTL